ncbi:MAG: hypothetical protein A2430_02285 [Candidatus Liptonbacteria bacterium RIFOXYC1_FULL_36_8]|uniref:ABC transporter substrate-binding protein n=3 Tax=Candidatus Liptoniibacteriota TaxID=1817909 RepID=A0A1G2CLF6_9BACT|nr:MAG: hypothetical protein A2390_00910 [Candidatus Liptonbacteria bacterium RIFOXYB1_FULL_36_10]OGZ02886.1 MAG: hypothetical protein A2430_02285 [Candidatus Liptonbacteria bacterium RIFOXYC1_FULL_36_8]OGZ03581.1 MAG: hypothetical protein A2604_00280 [Candidatus Liptonbacteria bacterium RIFOXYD1_FULL_36_11]
MSNSRLAIISLSIVLIVSLFGAFYFFRRADLGAKTPLTFWGVYDDAESFSSAIAGFQKLYPNISVNYVKKDETTYESDLLNALALDEAPDIIMIHNSWLPKYANKLASAPDTAVSIKTLRDSFPGVVEQDFTASGKIFALPLNLDTLALFYNKKLFNSQNIAFPPATWDEFSDDSAKLKKINQAGKIERAGAAFGGSADSINRESDILSLLMLQSGAAMVKDDFSEASFFHSGENGQYPGQNALNFYVSFANPKSSNYTWNDNLHYSIDAFSEGSAAMMINYSHKINEVKTKNPFLDFGVAPVPQLKGADIQVNYPDYWGAAVLSKSKNTSASWTFTSYLSLNLDAANSYFQTTKRPPALRSLISSCQNDPDIGSFCSQSLSARSWPKIDNNKIDIIFSDMIKSILSGKLSSSDALRQAEDNVTLLMKQL